MSVRRGRDGREIVEELRPPSCQVPSCARVPHRLVAAALACEAARQIRLGARTPARISRRRGAKGRRRRCTVLPFALRAARVARIPQRSGWSARRAFDRLPVWPLAPGSYRT